MVHKHSRPLGPIAFVWAYIRGVHRPEYWRAPCARCGFTGMVHWNMFTCRRFKVSDGHSKLRKEVLAARRR